MVPPDGAGSPALRIGTRKAGCKPALRTRDGLGAVSGCARVQGEGFRFQGRQSQHFAPERLAKSTCLAETLSGSRCGRILTCRRRVSDEFGLRAASAGRLRDSLLILHLSMLESCHCNTSLVWHKEDVYNPRLLCVFVSNIRQSQGWDTRIIVNAVNLYLDMKFSGKNLVLRFLPIGFYSMRFESWCPMFQFPKNF